MTDTLPTVNARYMPVAEVARELRKRLKAAFPGVKFSVRSHSYSMGASINVRWTDGPQVPEVEKIRQPLVGSDFDPMIDLKTHRDAIGIGGEYVRSGADYIFCDRDFSDAYRAQLVEAIEEAAKTSGSGKPVAERAYDDVIILRGDDGELHILSHPWADDMAQNVWHASRYLAPREA